MKEECAWFSFLNIHQHFDTVFAQENMKNGRYVYCDENISEIHVCMSLTNVHENTHYEKNYTWISKFLLAKMEIFELHFSTHFLKYPGIYHQYDFIIRN